jgi:4-aminobutyrate aminotransferase/(S)-3-amino-2-methylpropionate transaminase
VAAIEAIKILSSATFLQRVNEVGEIMRSELEKWKEKYPVVGDVRGVGAMRLVEFVKDRDTKDPDPDTTLTVIKDAVAHGLIMIRAGLYSNCIRLLPPIAITNEQLTEGLAVLEAAIARTKK